MAACSVPRSAGCSAATEGGPSTHANGPAVAHVDRAGTTSGASRWLRPLTSSQVRTLHRADCSTLSWPAWSPPCVYASPTTPTSRRLAALAGAGGTVVPAGLRALLVKRRTVEALTSPPDDLVSYAPSWGTFGQWRAARCLVCRAQLARRGPVRIEESRDAHLAQIRTNADTGRARAC